MTTMPPLPEPQYIDKRHHDAVAYTEAQLLAYRAEVIEMCATETKVEADYSGSNRKAVLMWAVEKIRSLK